MKTDVTSLLGLPIALACILIGQHLEGGHLGSILQVTALLIVIGGTAGAVLASFPARDVMSSLRALKDVVSDRGPELRTIIPEIVACGQIARTHGLLAVERRLGDESHPFLLRALRLAIDGTDPKILRQVLESEIEADEQRARRSARVFEAAGGYAPTVGIVGAVLGLIQVMENLTDPARMGSGIAVAFVATVYGVGVANLVLLPIANKLRVKAEQRSMVKAAILEGAMAVQLGENPRIIAERLVSYLPNWERAEGLGFQTTRAAA